MEKLILPCGRYIPLNAGDSESRIRSMEAYMARLSEELEVLLEETGKTLDSLQTAQKNFASMSDDREGGN